MSHLVDDRQHYPDVLMALAGIMKEKSWRDYIARGAKCLKAESVRSILSAKILRKDRKGFDFKALRQKVVAVLMIVNHSIVRRNVGVS